MSDQPDLHRHMPPHLCLLSGALMGTADAVPGVSGGTIALIIGIYDRFIESLNAVVKSPLLLTTAAGRERVRDALYFLVPLGIGLLAAYYVVTKILVGKSAHPGILLRPETAPACYGFFFGLVLLSLREPWRRIRRVDWHHYVAAAGGLIGAVLFVGLPYAQTAPATPMIALGGAGAIAVMLLPGVSGSLFLVIIGQYATVAGAVHDRDLVIVAVFAAGIGLGVIAFVPFLRALLHRHHDVTMAALTGLMAGSLRALWPWKMQYDPKAGPLSNVGFGEGQAPLWLVAVAAVAGAAVVWLLAILERRVLEIEAASDDAPSDPA